MKPATATLVAENDSSRLGTEASTRSFSPLTPAMLRRALSVIEDAMASIDDNEFPSIPTPNEVLRDVLRALELEPPS